MRTASAAFKAAMQDNTTVQVRAELVLADGTEVAIGGDGFMLGMTYTASTSGSSSFDVGSAIIGEVEFTLANFDGTFDGYVFDGATITMFVGKDVDGAGTMEWVQMGVYDVEQPDTYGKTIAVKAYDMLGRLEKPYSGVSTVYPATLGTIAADICSHCGVGLESAYFDGYSYQVASRPEDSALTCLDVLGYVAQASGNFARCIQSGSVRIGWYDTSSEPSRVDVAYVDTLSVRTDDVLVTGVSVTAQGTEDDEGITEDGETYLSGNEGYVLSIEDNPLVLYGQAQAVAGMVAAHVVGMTFRPLSATVLANPLLEPGDAMAVTDTDGTVYASYATTVTYGTDSKTTVSCDAETAKRNGAASFSALTKVVRKLESIQRSSSSAVLNVVNAINQHFFTDTNGAHVASETKIDPVTGKEVGDPDAGFNSIWNSLGLLFRQATTTLLSITTSAIQFHNPVTGNPSLSINPSSVVIGDAGYEEGDFTPVTGDPQLSISQSGINWGVYGVMMPYELFAVEKKPGTGTPYMFISDVRFGSSIGESVASKVASSNAEARGANSFAYGEDVIAKESEQFVIGRLNADDTSALFIVGNGRVVGGSASRHNAFAVHTDGTVIAGSDVTATDANDNAVSLLTTAATADAALPKAGGTMTGTLTVRNAIPQITLTATAGPASAYVRARPDGSSSTNGTVVQIGSGGNLILGSGEFSNSLYNADIDGVATNTGESLYLGSDGSAHIYTNANTLANRHEVIGEASGTWRFPGALTCGNEGGATGFYSEGVGFSAGDEPSAMTTFGGLHLRDEDKVEIGSVQTIVATSGAIGTRMRSRQPDVGGSAVANDLSLYVRKDGTRVVGMTDPAPWRDALGIQAGTITGVSATANAYVDYPVTFDKAYSAAPVVVVGFYSTSTAAAMAGLLVTVAAQSTTGFTARVFNNTSSARTPQIKWIAVGT